MIGWCLCNTAAATASWASVDLDRFLERTESGNWFRRAGRRAGGKRQPAQCLRKTQDEVCNSFRGKEASAPLHRRACKSPNALLRRVWMHSQVLLRIMYVQVCMLWSEGCFYYYSKRNNVVVLFGTLKVQSFMLTEVRDCDLLIVVTSSTFLKRKDMLKEKSS